MRKLTVAFDVDGTLISETPEGSMIKPNERIRELLVILSSFKNVKIVVWSGGGELYARQVAGALGIQRYVHSYAAKNMVGRDENDHPLFDPDLKPDIAIDDIHSCELGNINLIVNEK